MGQNSRSQFDQQSHAQVVALGDGHAAAEAEGAGGDFDAGGHLFAFVFVEIDHAGVVVSGATTAQFAVVRMGKRLTILN